MNLPNSITVSRLLAIPLLLFLLLANFPIHYQLAAGVFLLAAATDLADGH
ncbi:MAG: CDP-alcohol phosphatidyltransferase family protein, partial [Candidatus Dormibacteraceae bacterium]